MNPPEEWPRWDGKMTSRANATSVNFLKTAHNVTQ